MTENFWSSYNGHVSKSTWSPECCYDWGQGAVVCVRVVSRWWLPQVHAGYEISAKAYSKICLHAHEARWGQCRCFPCQSWLSKPCLVSSVAISITDTYNPDTSVRPVLNGKLRTMRRRAMGGMMSSASQIACMGIPRGQDFSGMSTLYANEIHWIYLLLMVWTLITHDGSTNCVHFSG